MNGHPRRDTDAISRLSKSTIQDLSFYIGFTRIGSRIQDLGLYFGMNGHFRSDPDVISRLPESTIHLYRFRNIQDLGPCFGMNGHFRMDPDVISTLPESTTDFLSC